MSIMRKGAFTKPERAMEQKTRGLPRRDTRTAPVDDEISEVSNRELETLVRRLLSELGENPEREGLKRTPERIAAALRFLTSGYDQTAREVVQGAIFTDDCNEMVIVKDVEFYSQCEHHMLPFFGRVHVGYVPDGKTVGLMDIIKPRGVGVVVEASHFCMMMRGVQKQNSSTLSSAMRGSFQSDARTRMEFMDLIRR